MFSSSQQDYYIYENHFKYLKRRGYYADVIVNHPISGSNTVFWDRCLNWRGICVENDGEKMDDLIRARGCKLEPTCITPTDRTILKQTVRGKRIKEKCMSLGTLLKRNRITSLDYMSLSVDRRELDILRGADWNTFRINVMTIDTKSNSLADIRRFLGGKGYRQHVPDRGDGKKARELLGRDAIFLHKDVNWGTPV